MISNQILNDCFKLMGINQDLLDRRHEVRRVFAELQAYLMTAIESLQEVSNQASQLEDLITEDLDKELFNKVGGVQ